MKTHERSNGDFKTSFYFKQPGASVAGGLKSKFSPATRIKPPSPVTKFTKGASDLIKWHNKRATQQQKCHDVASIPHHPHVSSIKQLVHELCLLQDFVHHLTGGFFLHTGFSFPFFWHCKKERNHKRPHTNASFRLEHILHWWNTWSAPLRQNMLDTC